MHSTEEIEFITKYNGRKLTEADRSTYEKWALDFFHQKESVQDPYLQITLQLDITKAYSVYTGKYEHNQEASFTSYLMWHIVHAAQYHPCLRYRKIGDEWYIFDQLPLYAPIAIGGDARFADLKLEPFVHASLEDFFSIYRKSQDKLFNDAVFTHTSPVFWQNSWFIGNLPNLQFTGFQLHSSAVKNGRPYFYFGKRYTQNEQLMIPLLITFDHANLDPFVLSAFMTDFQKSIDGEKL